uniref:Uncharacterized protein n=1 Tax=Plectus sambesii TaxID=2011161 RepID=A0A914WJN2_9BILA
MPGIGSNGSSISPRPLDDMGSTKAIVDDVVQKAKDPLDSNFSDQTWLRKASDALHIHKSQRQFSEDLTRAYFFVLDNEIQLALRTKNTRSSEDYLKR